MVNRVGLALVLQNPYAADVGHVRGVDAGHLLRQASRSGLVHLRGQGKYGERKERIHQNKDAERLSHWIASHQMDRRVPKSRCRPSSYCKTEVQDPVRRKKDKRVETTRVQAILVPARST
jgi:hypothetical protein